MTNESSYDWTDVKTSAAFLLLALLISVVSFISNQWWLLPVVMALYVICLGIGKIKTVKQKPIMLHQKRKGQVIPRVIRQQKINGLSTGYKLMIALIFLIQLTQVIVFISVSGYVSDLINVLLDTYQRLDANNMLDKSISVINELDVSLPFNCVNRTVIEGINS